MEERSSCSLLQGDPALARSFTGHRGVVSGCTFNSSMRQLYTGSADGSVMVWNMKPQMRAFRLLGHTVRYAVLPAGTHAV